MTTDKHRYREDQRAKAQHLHDYRVNKTRGQEVRTIARTCIACGKDARPRWLFCSDECSARSREATSAALIAGKGKRG